MKRVNLIFDYNKIFSEKGGRMNRSLSKNLIDLALSGNNLGMVMSRTMLWLKENNPNVLQEFLQNTPLTNSQKKMISKRISFYSGNGSEKFEVKLEKNKLKLVEDKTYRNLLDIEEIFSVQEIIKKSLPPTVFKKKNYLKQHLSSDSEGILKTLMRVQDIKESESEKILSKIRKNLARKKGKFSKISVHIDQGYIGFNFKDKRDVIKDLLKSGFKETIYYGNFSKRSDKEMVEIFEKKVNFILIENPAHMLSLMKNKKNNPLKILQTEKLRENVLERLENYWKYSGLPHDWIKLIIETLTKYSYDEDLAIKKIRETFPEITKKDSREYTKRLKDFRKVKVKNLSKRIAKYVQGNVLSDVGGRQEDFVEQILKRNKNIKRAYVTDIGSFETPTSNPKINFVIHPSLTGSPFPNKSIDTLLFSMVLHHLEDKAQGKLIDNFLNSLNEQGVLILIEDTYPENKSRVDNQSRVTQNFLNFSTFEKMRVLYFYDWFGNRLMRNRDNIALVYNYKTMESWEKIFRKKGMNLIFSEFIKENESNPDIFPPKAIMVFKKETIKNKCKLKIK